MVFPPPRHQGGFSNHFSRGPGPRNINFPMQAPNQPTQTRGLQNIISQIFKPGTSGASATDIASKGVGGLSNTLNNVQQVLKVVETTAPMVKQYGPMVKNLPMMFKMLKAFTETESSDNEGSSSLESDESDSLDFLDSSNMDSSETVFIESESSSSSNRKKNKNQSSKSANSEKVRRKKSNEGVSTPKLFIPNTSGQ